MSCCSAKTIEDTLEPYELRARYISQIQRLSQKGLFGQAVHVFKELLKNLGVNAATKRLSKLGIADLVAAKDFLVDRDAYRYVDRLHEALIYNNEHQASHMCKLMLKHFDFDPSDDVLRDLEKANRETLGKSDSSVISIYGLDLSENKNVKKLIALFSRCPKVKKIELVFCSLSNEIAFKVFQATMKLETLHYLGLRGNKLDMRSVYNLLNIVEQSEHFPTLVWVDFRNNKGINTIPGELVQRFTKRRTRQQGSNEDAVGKTVFSVQDAINGRVV